jgi:hypothetical protein
MSRPQHARHFSASDEPRSEFCKKAHAILGKATDAAESFHVIFRDLRKNTAAGTSSDDEQDILRAMLVFACAGLDSSLKQLVRDALPEVIAHDAGAQRLFTQSVKRKLPNNLESSQDLLAAVLTAVDPRKHLIDLVMSDLIESSLQSVSQFSKVAAAFDIVSNDLIAGLKEAFDARNQIIHEMDVSFGKTRTRRQRKKADMERLTKHVLDAAATLLARVDAKITP